MLKKFAKKIAITINTLLFLQLAFFGLNANAGAAFAAEKTDLIAPIVNGVNYGGQKAVLTSGNNFIVDISQAKDEDLQTAEINVSEAAELNVAVLGEDTDIELIAGVNVIEVDDILGEEVKLEDIQAIASILGTVTLDLTLTDDAKNVSKYELVIAAKDLVAPTLTGLSFAGTLATFDKETNVYSVGMNGIGNKELESAKIGFTLSEKSNVKIASLNYDSGLLSAGVNTVDLTAAAGKAVTIADLKAIAENGIVKLLVEVTDTANVPNVSKYEIDLILDITAPVVKVSVLPSAVNDAAKYTKVVLSANEPIQLVKTLVDNGIVLTQGTNPAIQVTIETSADSKMITVMIPEKSFSGKTPVHLKATVSDLSENVTIVEEDFTPDVVAPLAVTNLSAVVNTEGNVVLTWTNPNKAENYATIQILRDGAFLTTLPIGATTFVDTNVVKGGAYKYQVVVIDAAGNQTTVVPVSVTTPAPVVAAVATDTSVITAPAPAKTEEKEVKSETSENKENETIKKNDKLPVWGIVILVILAGIGAYLYFSPEENTKPITQSVRISETKKKPKKVSKKK